MIKQEENIKIDILKKEFPECFGREGNFNIEKFQEIISPEAKIFKDSYGLNWLGKSYARALAQVEARTMIRENVEHNKKDENKESENLYIKGDNLEVLRHLNNGYRDKIKMIYIDPPYNTKSGEFVYNDNRDFSKKELEKLVEAKIIDEDEKERILKWEGSSSSHSAWLTFMFPRLYLARKLLTENGVIFISIDDNEMAQLKLMCDEIFGEENFLGNVIRTTGQTTGQDGGGFGSSFDIILGYSKNPVKLSGLPLNEKDLKRFENKDEVGRYAYDQMRKTGSNDRRSDRPKLFYPIINPDGDEVLPVAPAGYESCWRFEKKTYKKLLEDNMILWKKTKRENEQIWWPYVKYYLEGRTKRPSPLWDDLEGNKKAARDLRELFKGVKVFDFPKPVPMIERLIQIIPNFSKDCIILDFFSGSASTAHAINKLNLKDDGCRKWIMVQLEEKLDSKQEAYKFCEKNNLPKNITSIGTERIKRANNQMLDELETEKKEGFDKAESEKKLGFKIFKIDNRIKELEEMKKFTSDIKLPEPISFIHNDKLDLVHTYKLQDGNFLNTKVEKIEFSWVKNVVGGDGTGLYIYVAYKVGNILYLIDSINSNEVLKGIIEKIDNDPEFKINKLVVYGFTNTNGKYRADLLENIHNYNNKKGADIEVEVRY